MRQHFSVSISIGNKLQSIHYKSHFIGSFADSHLHKYMRFIEACEWSEILNADSRNVSERTEG